MIVRTSVDATPGGGEVGADSVVPPAEAVTPLVRGAAVLVELTEAGGTLSLSALERATGLARSTVDRITATLARMGYVRLDGRDAVLAPRVMELGNAYLAALRLPALLDERADALADELDESVSLAVSDRDGIRFIHQATRRRAMSLSFRIGDLLPAERTAPGPLFATEWTDTDWHRWRERRAADPQDRGFPAVPPRERPSRDEEFERAAARAGRDGFALDDQLIEPGLVAVSVPVRDPRTGRIACVASVVSHTSRHPAAGLRDTLLPRLRAAVDVMRDDLREAPAPEPGAGPMGLATWTGASKQELGREFVESLARGLTVLTAFGEGRAELTLTDVAKATGLARATARRALITYEHLGLVTRPTDRTFALTPRVLSLGFPPLSRTSLPQIATPHLTELAQRIQESTSLAVLVPSATGDAGRVGGTGSGPEIQYTARASTSRVMTVNIALGTRLPAYATSLGRVLLADLPAAQRDLGPLHALTSRTVTDPTALAYALEDVRAQGYALVDEELEAGLRSIAVPVRDRTGRVVAALNTAMHPARRTLEACLHDLLPELTATADRIQSDLHVAERFTHVALS
ncbi:IclR family transcriptional regulator C-terminal domain-containing protein [Streptomyces griseus]|uniref:IclR family transcriptional regulator domain-containing protein n=1 Tax=Streptomyces griseus TaxID=1911 RepID=UPI00056CB096|nr:IclR family transcriptional regulator C-terminal domain-containing protein [Streptomyces griseus]